MAIGRAFYLCERCLALPWDAVPFHGYQRLGGRAEAMWFTVCNEDGNLCILDDVGCVRHGGSLETSGWGAL